MPCNSLVNEQYDGNRRLLNSSPDRDVVISGIAGRFPDSDNIKILEENLMNKTDMIRNMTREWTNAPSDVPRWCGKVNNTSKFDAKFFGVATKDADMMDPSGRMLLEHAYEVIVDAGINPKELRGTKTGVFIGNSTSEMENSRIFYSNKNDGAGITGCSRYMLANRVSSWFGISGPSITIDTVCSSGLYAFECAFAAIKNGRCDAALVGGTNLCLFPSVTLQFARLGLLSRDGRCKVFDERTDGYVRSETIAFVFLQRRKDARRIYADVVHAKSNSDGFKEQGFTFPSRKQQTLLMKEVYASCGVPPSAVNYVEAHGTGTKVGDPEEMTAISEIIITMESGCIPPNMNFEVPRKEIPAILDGRVKIVDRATPFDGGYVCLNSFGVGGSNVHVLLKSHAKEKTNCGAPNDELPRLVVISGSTNDAVETLLNDLRKRPVDVEYIRLLHDIYGIDTPGHFYRGFIVLSRPGLAEIPLQSCQRYDGVKRPVCLVFSGIGLHWWSMGNALMKIPSFASSIEKCDVALKPYGINVADILTAEKSKITDGNLTSSVVIAAIQIGLVNFFTSIGISADNVIGHVMGALGCAYADGCLTAEQMILAAYYQGQACSELEIIRGSMAMVELSSAELRTMCPDVIDIACYNNNVKSIISGPADNVRNFVSKLKANNIFAEEIPCRNIPYHSRYVSAAAYKLQGYLHRIIPDPKPRTRKWLNTSGSRNNSAKPSAQLCSAEYLANHLLNPVLFNEISELIPDNAITIEISPHGFLQDVHSASTLSCRTNFSLELNGHRDYIRNLTCVLGKLYEVGLDLQLQHLYPEVQYPVSRGTPMISPLIRWNHSKDWNINVDGPIEHLQFGERTVEISRTLEISEFMYGHVIDRRNLIPATGYLKLIWETLTRMEGQIFEESSVVFENVKFLRATTIPLEGGVTLNLIVQRGTGSFAVVEGDTAVVIGTVRLTANPTAERIHETTTSVDDLEDSSYMSKRDVYKILRLRGYEYKGLFRGIQKCHVTGTTGYISWVGNWVAFMDNMLQIKILSTNTRELLVPTAITKLVIDPRLHSSYVQTMTTDDRIDLLVQVQSDYDTITSGGIEIRGLQATSIARRGDLGNPVLEKSMFIAHRDRAELPLDSIMRMTLQIVLENHIGVQVKTIEYIDPESDVPDEGLASPIIQNILDDLPLLRGDVEVKMINKVSAETKSSSNNKSPTSEQITESNGAILIISHGLFESENIDLLREIQQKMTEKGFLLAIESSFNLVESSIGKENFDVIIVKRTEHQSLMLLRKTQKVPKITSIIRVNNNEFAWLSELQTALKAETDEDYNPENRILLLSERDSISGIEGLIKCLRREPGGMHIRGLYIQDMQAPRFSLENSFYRKQLELDLVHNVLRSQDIWGSYTFLALEPQVPRSVQHAFVYQTTRGDLSSLNWIEGSIKPNSRLDDIVKIHYSSLNFRDIMLASGKLGLESIVHMSKSMSTIGIEYSGVDESSGHRVMGVTAHGGLSNLCLSKRCLQWIVPENWTLEDAATVPIVYATCYCALYTSGRMKKGDKVLIHAGSGGIGQAAITLALHEGCEVFTTVGTSQKRDFIKRQFPQINDKHIGNSRDTSFEQLILRETNGRGVDLVLNSLAEEKLQASVRCLAHGGRFLEIGKFDLAANNLILTAIFLKGISFHSIHFDCIFKASVEKQQQVHALVQNGIYSGAVKPLSRIIFAKDQLEPAFRYMAAGKHIGKILIKIRDDEQASGNVISALPRFYCLEDCSYLIHGGLGGFGLELADWLVLRGARKLVLTSRTGITEGYQRRCIFLWKSYGVAIRVISGEDASTREGCETILKQAVALGPVDAIFNLAVVLKDGLCENQTAETFNESLKVKAGATKQLDTLSRILCPQLRRFVVFSSVSCGRGNAGQSNYGMANSIMERICEARAEDGLPACAIEWGAIGDVGLVAEMQEDDKDLVIGGTLPQGITSCLRELDGFLTQESTIVSSMVVAEKKAGHDGAFNIVDTVLHILGMKNLDDVSYHTSLAELGMDSMMAAEIKQTLEREFDISLSPKDIRNLNFAKILELSNQDKIAENESSETDNAAHSSAVTGLIIKDFTVDDISNEICLPMQTQREHGAEIFLIPGIEGSYTSFTSLCSSLKSPATCLHAIDAFSKEPSVADEADFLLPHVKKRMMDRSEFVVVGYSYGSLVALELASRLESEGFSGRVVLIDGSPKLLKAMVRYEMAENRDQLQSRVLLNLIGIIKPTAIEQLSEQLLKCSTWDAKLEVFLQVVEPSTKNLQANLLRQICNTIYSRIIATINYDPRNLVPIKSPIILIKALEQTYDLESQHYGLDSFTEGKLVIHHTDGNHISILNNVACAAAISGDLLNGPDLSEKGPRTMLEPE